ncbi:MAG: MBL fold metallo-hydrolase [Deltaproteobacteria bacterium]|nr:MBL fold metallo-hydrolase [Deltaproteobacteria bacterium]MBN2672454.1 MBL fold metallo-hydrolase [Deltaproteobacteria bacterium]
MPHNPSRPRLRSGVKQYCSALCLSVISLLFQGCKDTPSESSPAQTPAAEYSPSATKLVLLGTGTPIPDSTAQGPASAVVTGESAYLVDAGTGVVRQAQAAYENGISQLRPDTLRIAFITHLHSDHTLGLPDLIFTPWIVGANEGMDIYGPPGLKKMVSYILLAWEDDLYIREKSKDPTHAIANNIRVHEIKPGQVFKNNEITVTAFPVKHGKWEHVYGYRFQTADRTIVISGDTTPTQTVIDACNGCDILLHEVYSHTGFMAGPPSWRSYHAAYHTSTVELAQLAEKAQPKLLVLYHKLFFGQTEDGLVAEITNQYPGKVSLGTDLAVY